MTTKSRRAAKVIALRRQRAVELPIDSVRVARENDVIYQPFGVENRDDFDLYESIAADGIRDPLVLSADGFLLSGHRRLAAARLASLEAVPVRYTEDVFEALCHADRLKLLRQFNRQRDKTPGERVREVMLDIDPEEAYEKMMRRRLSNYLLKPERNESTVELGERKKRSRITTRKFLDAAIKVIEANKDYWPLTDRRVHYLLLNDPPPRHDNKRHSAYVNDLASYKALTNLLTRARIEGLIPMEAIDDTTRPIQQGGGFSSPEEFIRQESENFLLGYSRNLMQDQPHHIEIMVEKAALTTIVQRVAREYCVPVTTGRGFSSLTPRHKLYRRFLYSGKKRLVLLMLTDFDPDGEQIAESFARSMRDDFGVEDIDARKVLLTREDIEGLPSDLTAKPSSPNYAKFIRKYGTRAVELDAAPVDLIQKKLREAIEAVIDVSAFNAQVELEKEDARFVEAHRRSVLQALGGG